MTCSYSATIYGSTVEVYNVALSLSMPLYSCSTRVHRREVCSLRRRDALGHLHLTCSCVFEEDPLYFQVWVPSGSCGTQGVSQAGPGLEYKNFDVWQGSVAGLGPLGPDGLLGTGAPNAGDRFQPTTQAKVGRRGQTCDRTLTVIGH